MGRSQRAGSVALPTDIVVGPWAGEEWVGLLGRIGEEAEDRSVKVSLGHAVDRSVKVSLGHAVERKRQRIGLLGRIGEEAEDRSVGSCRGKEMAENRCFIFVWEEGNGRASKEKAVGWEEGNCRVLKEKVVG